MSQIESHEKIAVWPHSTVAEVDGDARLGDHHRRGHDGRYAEVPAFALFIFIGAKPHTDWVGDVVERDPQGFILTGRSLVRGGRRPKGWHLDRDPFFLETSVAGIFAAGDVRHRSVKRVASAVGRARWLCSLSTSISAGYRSKGEPRGSQTS